MSREEYLKNVKRIVVKVGTSSITQDGILSPDKLERFVNDTHELLRRKYQIVIVSSGAISAGAGSLGRDRRMLTIPKRQAFASVGQVILVNEYSRCFNLKGRRVGQILLTEDDIKNRRRFLNARNAIEALLDMQIVPIVNENDSVVVKEIKFGDNDTLSAHVTCLMDAELLILLSDVDGFYWDMKDPAPLSHVTKITPELLSRAGGEGSIGGTGGMVTKLRAAELVMQFGGKMIIANSSTEGILGRIMDGEELGTIFTAEGKRLSGRKRWIGIGKPKGRLTLDTGAVQAVISGKKSLLASGITAVDGLFDMGEVVILQNEAGKPIGKGIVNYKSYELDYIKGKTTTEIKKLLGGSAFFDEVINRDDLIML